MTRRGMLPRQVNLPGVSYPGESLFSTLKFEYLSEISTKIENVLIHWSVTQTGLKEEKNWRSKISLDCPFKYLDRALEVKRFCSEKCAPSTSCILKYNALPFLLFLYKIRCSVPVSFCFFAIFAMQTKLFWSSYKIQKEWS